MYSEVNTKKLIKSTQTLLSRLTGISKEDISILKEILRLHEYRYYVLNDPMISDYEYDQLYKVLEKIEKENPKLITHDSPTQRVAKGLTKDFTTVPHLVPMLSLENSYSSEDLIDWDRKARELSKLTDIEYCVEPKFDGASISIVFENDFLFRAATRGDGVEGEEITTNLRQIRSVPLSAPFSEYGIQTIEIRGEVMMNKTNFKKYNDQLAEQNLPPLANARNSAAGSLRIKDPQEVKKRNLEAFLYNVSFVSFTNPVRSRMTEQSRPSTSLRDRVAPGPSTTLRMLKTHSGTLDFLSKLGFRCPINEMKVLKGIKPVIEYCEQFEQQRDNLPYEIDGMVIKVNDVELQERLGMTTHHPRWAIAYKFKARQATSKLRNVEFYVGRTGSITPVAKIDPAQIGGITIVSISLFNEEVIREKNLLISDSVLVERAGDVIPYIVKSFPELRTGSEKKIVFPTHCPVCGDKLVKSPDEAVWRCNNINCEAQVVERIIHFTSRDAMDIRGFGEANVKKFFALGFLKDIPGIYQLPFDKIRQLEGFGEKSISNLQSAIENSKEQQLHRLIFGLGIRYVGETTAKVLAQAANHLLDFKDNSVEELQNLQDIGPKVAGSIYQFFHNNDNIQMIQKLEDLGLKLQNKKKVFSLNDTLNGQTFLFTGTLPTLKRNDAEEMVEKVGGKLLGGVSSKLNYLVVGDDAGSKLEKAKKIHSIKIINESEFLRLVGSREGTNRQ